MNKKIKFDDDGDQQKNDLQLSKQKISLFDDDDASDHENQGELVPDFKLKLRFEGEKGKKVTYLCRYCYFIVYTYCIHYTICIYFFTFK